MLYAIIATDSPDSTASRVRTRPKHLEYIRPLMEAGRVILAGPHPAIDTAELNTACGMTGSLIVAEFPSLQEAQIWAENDPYMVAGVFAKIQVKPFIRVYP